MNCVVIRTFLLIFIFGIVPLMSSCTPSQDKSFTELPTYALSFHCQVPYPSGTPNEELIESLDGQIRYWAYSKPRFHSREIKKIFPIPREREPGYYDLRLILTKRGGHWWDNMIDYCYNEHIIVALDGHYLTRFKAQFLTEDTYDQESLDNLSTEPPQSVIVRGPFSEELTRNICSKALYNRRYYDKLIEAKQKALENLEPVDPYEEALKREREEREKQRKELRPDADFNPLKLFNTDS